MSEAKATRRQALVWGLSALASGSWAADPILSAAPLRRIAFGSCDDQTKPAPIWQTVLAWQPDLYLFAGDNVYASRQPWTLAALEAAYAQLSDQAGFATLRTQVPHMAIWDDHDYGKNDAGADFEHKQASKDAFLKFWAVPADDERRSRDGLYHARIVGPVGQRVQIIMLDTRWFRSPWRPTDHAETPGKERYVPDDNPDKTMLGDAQWAWLAAQLRQSADLRLIVSGVQILAEGHGYERWGLLPRERQRLFDLIAQTRANGVLLLSGDRHIGAVYRQSSQVAYPLTEVTSSGITHTYRASREPGPNRLGELVTDLHFGTVEIDWPARRVAVGLVDLQGAPQRTQVIPFDALTIP